MFVVKINSEKGTIVVADKQLTTEEFQVKGFKATTSNGETPNKFGWFRILEFEDKKEEIYAAFKAGVELKELKFGKATNLELKGYAVEPV